MLKYHEILRLTHLGYCQTAIALSTNHSRVSVHKVQTKASKVGIPIDELLRKTDAELHSLLSPEEQQGPTKRIPDFAKLRKELCRSGVTKKTLWAEYVNLSSRNFL